jgi:hypothetical protein
LAVDNGAVGVISFTHPSNTRSTWSSSVNRAKNGGFKWQNEKGETNNAFPELKAIANYNNEYLEDLFVDVPDKLKLILKLYEEGKSASFPLNISASMKVETDKMLVPSYNIIGEIKDLRINFKKYGNSSGYPIFLRFSLSSDVLIQFKDNRYRVILKNIGFLDDVSLYSSKTFKESDNFTYLSEFYIKNDGTMRTNTMVDKTLDVMNKHFTDLFTYKVVENDW